MITLPAGAWPEGLVRVTMFPARVCLPLTVNPSLSSASRALAKVRPATAGTATTGGVLEAVALTVGVAPAALAGEPAGEPAGDAERELAGAAERVLAGAAELEVAGAAETEFGGGAAATRDLDADADVAVAAAGWLAGGGAVVLRTRTTSSEGCAEALSRHAVNDPAISRSATPAIAKVTRSSRRERPAAGRVAAALGTEVVDGSPLAPPMSGLSSRWLGSG